MNREIALKRFREDRRISTRAKMELIREAQITGQLEHPNIIPIHELSTMEDGTPYYTMKLLRGQTLSQRIRDYHRARSLTDVGELELRELLRIFIDICNAMAYAGSRAIVHRDLKPQNIMLGDFGEVLVLDWGLATIVDKSQSQDSIVSNDPDLPTDFLQTSEGEILGTPAYMAPEQAAGHISKIDHRTDVYGLGGVLFAILAGQSPHHGQRTGNSARDTRNLLERIIDGPAPDPKQYVDDIPGPLRAICMKALAPRRSHRYQDASDLAEDIKRWLGDEPVAAFPEPLWPRVQRWIRKNRAKAQAVAGSVCAIAIVAVFAAFIINGAKHREEQAHQETKVANNKLKQANDAEMAAKKDAVEQFKRARRAIDESLTAISDGLLDLPGTEGYRVRFLERAAQEYKALAEQKSDQPELKLEYARASARLGDVHRMLRQEKESRTAYVEALDGIENCIEDSEARAIELARVRNKLGLLNLEFAKFEESEAQFQTGIDLIEGLVIGDEPDLDAIRVKASLQGNLASLLSRINQDVAAMESLDQATYCWTLLFEKLGLKSDQLSIGKTHIVTGEIRFRRGDYDKALKEFQKAAEICQILVNDDQNNPDYLRGLADAQVRSAQTQNRLGNTASLVDQYNQAITNYAALIQTRPDIPAYRENRIATITELAIAHFADGNLANAETIGVAAVEDAVVLRDQYPSILRHHVAVVNAQITLAMILRDRDKHKDARIFANEAINTTLGLIDIQPDLPDFHQLLGECRTILAVQMLLEHEWQTAIDLLKLAQADFHKTLELVPELPTARDGLAWAVTYMGDALFRLGKSDEARIVYEQAIKLRKEAQNKTPNELANEAWAHVSCLIPELGEPSVALESATRAARKTPNSARYQFMVAAAHYRDKEWNSCLQVLAKAEPLRTSRKDGYEFLEAMALWQNDQKEIAKQKLAQAIKKMSESAPGDYRLRYIRAEAEELLQSQD